jgi:Zn-dependent protease with chaperone function
VDAVLQAPAPTGLYGWIKGNDARSLKLFAGFALAIQLLAVGVLVLPLTMFDEPHSPILGPLGYLTRYVPLVFLGSVAAFGVHMLWYMNTVKKASGFQFVDAGDEPRLCAIIEPLIVAKGMKPPYLAVIDTQQWNAFACGISSQHAVVVVTRGLIDTLNDEELAAVLAHELAHVRNGDIRLMAAVNICMRLMRTFKKAEEYEFNAYAAAICVAIPALFPIIVLGCTVAQLGLRWTFASRLAITSTREFIADAQAAELTRNPAALASALAKIDGRHRLPHMRRDDDAMMIVGESEGQHASHPGVHERIDALTRVTGSMVFNAPGAASAEALGRPDQQGLFGAKRTASIMARAREAVPGGILGFSRKSRWWMAAAVAGFLALNVSDLLSPRAMAAKFDVRTIAVAMGVPDMACLDQSDPVCLARQEERIRSMQYQRGTLAGLMASTALSEGEGGLINPSRTAMRAYTGQSGKLTGVTAPLDNRGLFATGGGTFSSGVPEKLVIAEVDQVGCFQASMFYGEPEGHYSLGHDGGDVSIAKYREWAQSSLPGVAIEGSDAWGEKLRDYPERRELVLKTAYDMFGLPGLQTLLAEYSKPEHAETLELLREETKDPAYLAGLDPLARAKVKSLLRDPARFIPCLAVKHGA